MLNEKVAELLNEQINNEFFSAYLYLDIANYYKDASLDGFSNWFMVQAHEETDHALLFIQYLQNNDHKITLEAISKPKESFGEFIVPLKIALEHERFVTDRIHTIYDAAHTVKDFRSMQFLDWFVKEQGEEEVNTENLIKRFELYGQDSKGLYMLDNELGTRVYSAPTLVL